MSDIDKKRILRIVVNDLEELQENQIALQKGTFEPYYVNGIWGGKSEGIGDGAPTNIHEFAEFDKINRFLALYFKNNEAIILSNENDSGTDFTDSDITDRANNTINIGYKSGGGSEQSPNSIFVGKYSGFGVSGDNNIIIGLGDSEPSPRNISNRFELYIGDDILVSGDFDQKRFNIEKILNLKPIQESDVSLPETGDLIYDSDDDTPKYYNGSEWVDIKSIPWGYGDASNRPPLPVDGEMYFDTDLGYAIWWNGVNWVNATGAEV